MKRSWWIRRARAGLCVAGLFVLASCISVPVPSRFSSGAGGSVGWKVVMDKHDPEILVAADRTECVVGRDRFESVRRGERVFCHWR